MACTCRAGLLFDNHEPGCPLAAGRFESFTDAELDDLAVAVASAAGEGAFRNESLAREIAADFERRGREVPATYGSGTRSVEWWLSMLDA